MENQITNISELENIAQKMFGGRIVKGNLQNYDSFTVAPISPLALFYGPRITIKTNGKKDENTIYIHNMKYLFKANILANKFISETDQNWIVNRNIPKENKKEKKQRRL
jgi:hypothetical protein